jgi:hypothetical protein
VTAATTHTRKVIPDVELYRDDGPLARAIGAVGRAVPAPPIAFVLLAAAVVLVAIVLTGDGASEGLVGGVLAFAIVAGGLSSRRPHLDELSWAVPVSLRATEYAGLLWLGALAGGNGVPAVFALLCAVAFRQYDIVYRVRHRGVPPPAWTRAVSGGWDGRLVVGYVAWILGVLPVALFIAGGVLAVVLVGESALGWARAARGSRRQLGEDDDEDDV